MKNKFDSLAFLTIIGILIVQVYVYIGYKALLRAAAFSGSDFLDSLPNITSIMVAKPNVWHSVFGGILLAHLIVAFKNGKAGSFLSFFIIILIFLFLCVYGLSFMSLLVPLKM